VFRRHREIYPLVDIKTKNWRIIIGPCAAKVIMGLIGIAALIFFGPDIGMEVTALLRALGM
jgi:hypothetical protein